MVSQTGLNQHGLEPKVKMITEPLNPTSLAMSPASAAKAAESPGAGRERSGKKTEMDHRHERREVHDYNRRRST